MSVRRALIVTSAQAAFCLSALAQSPLGTAFTYQGRLESAAGPVNGLHDLRFRLYDVLVGGTPLGTAQCFDNVNVTDGLVSQSLDFSGQLTGQQCFLEIDVRADSGRDCTNSAGFMTLAPRQALTPTPYALFAQSVPVPLTLSGSSATHIIRSENASTTNGAAALFGEATGASGITCGGRFESDSASGRGVYGIASAASGSTYGVYGQASNLGGYGLFSDGNTGASGFKSFRIDHPDDPANKYLLHYATESPEVINIYSGNATLDTAGEALVELPRYFAKINRDPRYTLAAVGAPMPMLHVAAEIDEDALAVGARTEPAEDVPICSFRIAGGMPRAKVSWEIKAVRNDRWAQKRGAPVEVEKQGLESGTYQHPELYGQPPEKGMNYDSTRTEAALQAAATPR